MSVESIYRMQMLQHDLESVYDYTDLIIKDGLKVEDVALKRNVSVEEVNRILNVLKANNPMLYEQVQRKLSS